jgi:hypothetical protein
MAAGFRVMIRATWWNERLADEDLFMAASIGAEFALVIDLRKSDLPTLLLKWTQRLSREGCFRLGWEAARALGVGVPEMLRKAMKIRPDLTMVHCGAGLCVGNKQKVSVSSAHVGANLGVGARSLRSKGGGRSPDAGAAAGGVAALEVDGRVAFAGAQTGGWSQGRNLKSDAVGQAWEDVSQVFSWIYAKTF